MQAEYPHFTRDMLRSKHNDESDDLGCNALHLGRDPPTFRRNVTTYKILLSQSPLWESEIQNSKCDVTVG
jgi:hypothetical protein